jgi:hypothetical protein
MHVPVSMVIVRLLNFVHRRTKTSVPFCTTVFEATLSHCVGARPDRRLFGSCEFSSIVGRFLNRLIDSMTVIEWYALLRPKFGS